MTYPNLGYLIAQQTTPFGGPVPCAVALPGQGKTAVEKALADAAGRVFLPFYLRQRMPEDAGGTPAPDDIVIDGVAHRGIRYLLGEDMLRAKHQRSVILFDELNQAGDDMLGAVQEDWINNPPPNAWVCAAMNPVESSTSGRDLPPPIVNRMCILPWDRPTAARREGWRKGFRDYPSPSVPILPEDFLDTFGPKWGDVMCEFEDANMELFGDMAFPKDVNKASDPWPSDRSWTHVGILMAACDAAGADNGVRALLAEGCVGPPAAHKFMHFIMQRGLPDFEQLLAMPNTLLLPARWDLARAIVLGVIGRVTLDPSPLRWEAACDVLQRAYEQVPECGPACYGALLKAKPSGHLPRRRNGSWQEMERLVLGEEMVMERAQV